MIITEKASNRIKALKQENNLCSGLSYKLDFDSNIKTGDQEFNENEEKVVCDMKSFLYIAGTELDFSDGLNGKGFQFNNPNASRTCGCGESFAV